MKTEKRPDFKTWVIWTLRKASYRWPARGQAFRAAAATKADFDKNGTAKVTKRVRNFYWCALCEGVFPRKLVSADHIDPVIDPRTGFVNFDVYIKRLFCAASGFQIICKDCHDAKTAGERKIRKQFKKVHVRG